VFGSQTIRHIKIGKVAALQHVLIHCKTMKNGKISTRNEKVACSSQVTSSIKTPGFLENRVLFFSKIHLSMSSFHVLNRIKGRGPQKEQKEGDGFDG